MCFDARMYTTVSDEAGKHLVRRNLAGPVFMLNLLRFRQQADYSSYPELAPDHPISGREAYELYIEHTKPMLEAAGGALVLIGDGGTYLIGPPEEQWDLVLLVRHRGVHEFLSFASNPDYQKILGHRDAGVLDSRLLPVVERA